MKQAYIALLVVILSACAQLEKPFSGDDAIRRVEACECYASIEAQNLKPWEFAWEKPELLRKQVSHCVCRAHIDVSNVENPRKYLIPGTIVK